MKLVIFLRDYHKWDSNLPLTSPRLVFILFCHFKITTKITIDFHKNLSYNYTIKNVLIEK